MYSPLFSVVIPTYNSYEKLFRAIDSILKQSFQDFEIIIVDDGSSDNTGIEIQPFLSTNIHYFYKTNGGPASARNSGIRKARGKYICFLDADDEFMENKLLEYSKVLKDKDILIFSDAEYYNEKLNTSYIFSCKEHMRHSTFFSSLLENNFLVASTVCIKKSILENNFLFDENEKLKFVEDYDLWLKILNVYPHEYIEQPLTKYYIHESNNSSNVGRTLASLSIVYFKWSFFSRIAIKNFIKYSLLKFMNIMGIRR